MRIHVPKDVSVIGCDNIFYSGIRRISLTTIDHFVALKGRDACDIIIRKIDMNDKFYLDERPASLYNIEYTPKLIKRRTRGMQDWTETSLMNRKINNGAKIINNNI